MNVVVLEESSDIFEEIREIIITKYRNIECKRVRTPFALTTYVYDAVKGDVDILIVRIINKYDETISAVAALQDYFPHIHVIFYSECNDCAQEIFGAFPSFFLLYPFNNSIVYNALHRVSMLIDSTKNQLLSFYKKGQIFKIQIHSIVYIESVGRKLYIYTQSGSFEVNMTMEQIISKLPSQFVQCHRSYLVNIEKIRHIRAEELELVDQYIIPISRGRSKLVKQEFMLRNGGIR